MCWLISVYNSKFFTLFVYLGNVFFLLTWCLKLSPSIWMCFKILNVLEFVIHLIPKELEKHSTFKVSPEKKVQKMLSWVYRMAIPHKTWGKCKTYYQWSMLIYRTQVNKSLTLEHVVSTEKAVLHKFYLGFIPAKFIKGPELMFSNLLQIFLI